MSLLKPTTYDLDFILLLGGNDENTRRNRNRVALAIICLATFTVAKFWLNQVMKYVPEPYLVRAGIRRPILLLGVLTYV
jgi:hypothetical protein